MSAENAADGNTPRLLADLDSYLAQADEGQRGTLWRLAYLTVHRARTGMRIRPAGS